MTKTKWGETRGTCRGNFCTPTGHFLEPLLEAASSERYALYLSRSSTPIATRIEPAFDSESRNRGLLGRDRLADGDAVILAPCGAVHTWFMRFPIDILFAARDGRVLKVARAVRPWRIAVAWTAFATVELPVGTIDRSRIKAGDMLLISSA